MRRVLLWQVQGCEPGEKGRVKGSKAQPPPLTWSGGGGGVSPGSPESAGLWWTVSVSCPALGRQEGPRRCFLKWLPDGPRYGRNRSGAGQVLGGPCHGGMPRGRRGTQRVGAEGGGLGVGDLHSYQMGSSTHLSSILCSFSETQGCAPSPIEGQPHRERKSLRGLPDQSQLYQFLSGVLGNVHAPDKPASGQPREDSKQMCQGDSPPPARPALPVTLGRASTSLTQSLTLGWCSFPFRPRSDLEALRSPLCYDHVGQ